MHRTRLMYAAHLESSPRDFSCRSCSASAHHGGVVSGSSAVPIFDANAVSFVIQSARGTTIAASPPPTSRVATRPQPRPPGVASTRAGETLATSAPSRSSHVHSASKSACVRASSFADVVGADDEEVDGVGIARADSDDDDDDDERPSRWRRSGGGARDVAAVALDGRLAAHGGAEDASADIADIA